MIAANLAMRAKGARSIDEVPLRDPGGPQIVVGAA
jgi:hypothetical protein